MIQQLECEATIRAIEVSHDGEYLAVSQGYDSSYTAKVKLFRMQDMQLIAEVARSEHEGIPICFTSGGKVLAYSTGATVQLYDIALQQEKDYFFTLNVSWMAADRGHRLAIAGTFTEVWDVEHCEKLWQLPEYTTLKYENKVPALVDISSDGSMLVIGGNNTNQILIYSLEQNTVIKTLSGSLLQAEWISLSPDLRHLTLGTYINGVFICNIETRKKVLLDQYNSETSGCFCFCFHPSGNFFATGRFTGYVTIERISDGELILMEPLHQGRVWCIAFTPDGKKLISGGDDGIISILDLQDLDL